MMLPSRLLLTLIAVLACASLSSARELQVSVYQTELSGASALSPKANVQLANNTNNQYPGLQIRVDESTVYQTMTGFGASLTDSSCWLLTYQLTSSARTWILESLFGQGQLSSSYAAGITVDQGLIPSIGIGMSMLRQPIGATDFTFLANAYTFDDTWNDWSLGQFSTSAMQGNAFGTVVVPILQESLKIANNDVGVMVTAWSPPAWMKTSGALKQGGSLLPEAYNSFANYMVKSIQAFRNLGVNVVATSLQNEPMYSGSTDYPTMSVTAVEAIDIAVNHVGPALRNAGLASDVKLLALDHNWDLESYVDTVYANSSAYNTFAGSAWHHYGGQPTTMTDIHNRYPSKNVWFTEGGFGSWNNAFANTISEIINVMQNYAETYIMWNVALNQVSQPSSIGAGNTNTGLLEIRSDSTNHVVFSWQYYILGHFSAFVRPGAKRIASTSSYIDTVAFVDENTNQYTLVCSNPTAGQQPIIVQYEELSFDFMMQPNSINTFVWNTSA